MKVTRFLKRVGIVAIPIIAVIIVTLCFDGISTLSFNASHPDKLSQALFSINKVATCQGLVAIVIAFWVFANLMNWAKAKIRRMELKESLEADGQEGDDGENDTENDNDHGDNNKRMPNDIAPKFRVDYQRQSWYHVNRVIISMVLFRFIYGSCQLDIPKPHEKETEPFWQDCDAFLYALYVDTCARKHSLAKTMLAAAESVCQYRDCKTIGLRWDDRESEPWVLDWYKRMGYEEIRVEADGHAHFFVKDLTKDVDKDSASDTDKKDDAAEE